MEGVLVGKGVGDGVKVGSPGRWVTRIIFVGKLVRVGVIVIFDAIEVRTSVVATAKLPPMIMIEISAAKIPVRISRRRLIEKVLQMRRSVVESTH
jgi:hypothetical protein